MFKLLEKKLELVKIDLSLRKIKRPPLFSGTLRDRFQATGAQWLDDIMWRERFGILADEMGLGKTVQTIHAITSRIYFDPLANFLICVPRSLMATWVKAFKKFSPDLKIVYFPPDRNAVEILAEEIVGKEKEWRVVLVTDYLLDNHHKVSCNGKSLHSVCGLLLVQTWRKFDWDAVIIDEAHRISSEKGEVSKCVERLPRKATIMLTGTPTQTEVNQMVRLFKICDKRIFREMFLEKDDIFDRAAIRIQFQKVSIF